MAHKARDLSEALKSYLEADHYWGVSKGVGWGYDNNWDDVLLIQYFLNSIDKTNLALDGIFGKKTQKAIRAYQKSCNGLLTTDGKVNAVDGTVLNINETYYIYTIYNLNIHYKDLKSVYYEDLRMDGKLPSELVQIFSSWKNE